MALTTKYNLHGKVALVTGSSSGIGAEIATQFAANGAKVAITGRNADALEKIAERIREVSGGTISPLKVVGDLLEEGFPKKLLEQTVQEYGQLDILVNNAGGAVPNGSLDDPLMLDSFDKCFKLNVRVVAELTQLAVPQLLATKGNVINISSIAGMKPSPGFLVYSASKAAVDMVTKCSALELGPKGIRVNSINPGPIVSNFGRSLNMNADEFKEFQENTFIKNSLMKKIGEVSDIANLASFLASDDAKNITGSLMVSDSGFMVL